MGLLALKSKNEDHFLSPTIAKNGEIDILGSFLANFPLGESSKKQNILWTPCILSSKIVADLKHTRTSRLSTTPPSRSNRATSHQVLHHHRCHDDQPRHLNHHHPHHHHISSSHLPSVRWHQNTSWNFYLYYHLQLC